MDSTTNPSEAPIQKSPQQPAKRRTPWGAVSYTHLDVYKRQRQSDEVEWHVSHDQVDRPRDDHPHFYINLTRAKAKPEDKIVTGPVYLVMAAVPLYFIGLPFAFFPFNAKQTSGILMPSYGIDQSRGCLLYTSRSV